MRDAPGNYIRNLREIGSEEQDSVNGECIE